MEPLPPPPPPPRPLPPPADPVGGELWRVLQTHTDELQLFLARAGQLCAVVCMVLAIYMIVVAEAELGPAMMALSAALLLVYTGAHQLLVQQRFQRELGILLPAIETLVPSGVLAAMAATQGPAYALGSWAPPQLFAVFLIGSILRLRTDLPVIMGAVASLSFLAVTVGYVLPMVDDDQLLHQPRVQYVRTITLLALGAVVGLGVHALKRLIGEAGRTVRSNELFGKYRLGAPIASGGMGQVVEALYCPEGGFERRVAVKLIHPHLASDARFVERFREEAALSSRLHHPGIVAALDFGRSDATWFFVMEFVDGIPMSQLLKEHREARLPLDPAVVVTMGLQLADALHHAHAAITDSDGQLIRVLHRDLSPSNVLVDRGGQLKISDFGVARALRAGDSLHTKNLVGKPSYVAPEALRNEPIDERADLWSLAVVLWESVANQRLFKRSNEAATLLAVLEESPPPLAEVRPSLPPAWQAFFDRALATDPNARFPSADALREALVDLQRVSGKAPADAIARLIAVDSELSIEGTDSLFDG